MDYLGKDMRKIRKDDKENNEEEKEIKGNQFIQYSLWVFKLMILFCSVLDEGDIALLKSYVSGHVYAKHA